MPKGCGKCHSCIDLPLGAWAFPPCDEGRETGASSYWEELQKCTRSTAHSCLRRRSRPQSLLSGKREGERTTASDEDASVLREHSEEECGRRQEEIECNLDLSYCPCANYPTNLFYSSRHHFVLSYNTSTLTLLCMFPCIQYYFPQTHILTLPNLLQGLTQGPPPAPVPGGLLFPLPEP